MFRLNLHWRFQTIVINVGEPFENVLIDRVCANVCQVLLASCSCETHFCVDVLKHKKVVKVSLKLLDRSTIYTSV